MNELGYLIKALATLSWRFNTFRGQYDRHARLNGLVNHSQVEIVGI